MCKTIRPVRNENTSCFGAVAANRRTDLRQDWLRSTALAGFARVAILGMAGLLSLGIGSTAYALPTDGTVSAGAASISSTNTSLTVNQSSQNAAINWQSFGIGQGESVTFLQPNANSVTLNRVLGADPSAILGSLSANGKIFLVNPNGILFAQGAQVNVGGLVASTLGITDDNFMAANYKFAGSSNSPILNQGAIHADGGYVALLGANVDNEGVITAKLGFVTLAAGSAMTLDVAGNGLLSVTVDQGALNALAKNGGLIQANGGQVLITAKAAGDLLKSAVNNTGVIDAQTIETHNGTIKLLADSQTGVVNVAGTLDASAPNGGDGGSVETSAAHVKVADNAIVTTQSAQGRSGTWLIDPNDFTVAAGADIAGVTLSDNLVRTNVTILSSNGATGTNGDVNVDEEVIWTAAHTLTLSAVRNVNLNADITATGGNLVANAGTDIDVNAAVTTTDGGVTFNAGNNINVAAAMTTTRGNVVLRADNDGTGPGGGTVTFAPAISSYAVTGSNAAVTIYYSPSDYAASTDYSGNFTLTSGATLNAYMWLFLQGNDKLYDATTAATLSFMGTPNACCNDFTLVTVTAAFDNKNVGTDKQITYSGYSISG